MFSFGTSLSRTQRLLLGIFVLLLADVILVSLSELTDYIVSQDFNKPYLSTYLKSSLFIIYLLGFLVRRNWWAQCRKSNGILLIEEDENGKGETDQLLSDPIYVPIKFDDKSSLSGNESDDLTVSQSRSVRFSDLSEVRQLSEIHAEEAVLARLSYAAFVRAEEARNRAASKLSVKQVAKLALVFSVVFFFATLAYEEAMHDTQPSLVRMLGSSGALFTLVLAAMFPSGGSDRFTLSKLTAVLLSIGGVVLVSLSDYKFDTQIQLGALWALCAALLFAVFLVLLKRRVDSEEKLNLPMFLGFVGLFSLVLMWPGFFLLHYSRAEPFSWPTRLHLTFLLINALGGTALAKLLWLWGCFLTSSLLATLALSMTVPMILIADMVIKGAKYGWMFYCGAGPTFAAFFAVSVLTYYDTWDPVLLAVKKSLQCLCRRRALSRLRDIDREQSESLIGINSDGLRADT